MNVNWMASLVKNTKQNIGFTTDNLRYFKFLKQIVFRSIQLNFSGRLTYINPGKLRSNPVNRDTS